MVGEAKRRREAEAANTPEAVAERWRKAFAGGVMIGTPVFGGKPEAEYMAACEKLAFICGELGLKYATTRPVSESLIQRARNYVAREFLESPCEWLMWIDSDIRFEPEDILALLETGYPFVGGAYGRKQVAWEPVIKAARIGLDNPERFATTYVVNLLPEDAIEGAVTFDGKGCCEVLDLPTGFLLTHRSVYEKMRDEFDIAYTDDSTESRRPIWSFFECPIVEEGGRRRLLSEDYHLSRQWQRLGGKCMLHTGIELDHIGRHAFKGNRAVILDGSCR